VITVGTMNDSESKSGLSPSTDSLEKKKQKDRKKKKKSKSSSTTGGGAAGSVSLSNTRKKSSKKKKKKKKKDKKKKDGFLVQNVQKETDAEVAEPPPSLSCQPATLSSRTSTNDDDDDVGTIKKKKTTTMKKIKSKKRKRNEMSSSKEGKIDDGKLVADEGDGESNNSNNRQKTNGAEPTSEITRNHHKMKKKKRKQNNPKKKKNDSATSSGTGAIPAAAAITTAKTKDDVVDSVVPTGDTSSILYKNNTSSTTVAGFPFETEPDDHCESPAEAYEDIVPILQALAGKLKKPQQELSIYDPYYCDNRVARNLASLGFPKVYNRKEDCYKVWNDVPRYPSNDILVTNPPYSGEHMEKLIQHITEHQRQRGRPFALLLPVFVHKKDYFERVTNPKRGHPGFCSPIFLVPHKRYIYQPPRNFREKTVSDTHKKSSPFPSMWYLWGGSQETTDTWFRILQRQGKPSSRFSVARSKSALRDLRRKHKK